MDGLEEEQQLLENAVRIAVTGSSADAESFVQQCSHESRSGSECSIDTFCKLNREQTCACSSHLAGTLLCRVVILASFLQRSQGQVHATCDASNAVANDMRSLPDNPAQILHLPARVFAFLSVQAPACLPVCALGLLVVPQQEAIILPALVKLVVAVREQCSASQHADPSLDALAGQALSSLSQ
ncbi:hypothetical protein QJQ45_005288 [Haematococcus lacustris]|nr:hypothetical protein QJQ45_005288 [Haematococcus lacustris]